MREERQVGDRQLAADVRPRARERPLEVGVQRVQVLARRLERDPGGGVEPGKAQPKMEMSWRIASSSVSAVRSQARARTRRAASAGYTGRSG